MIANATREIQPPQLARNGNSSRPVMTLGILLAALFLTGVSSITKVVTGLDELPFLANWGGWISLVAFAIIAYILVRVPLRRLRKV